ncbi:MAG: sugar kinase, partial [Sinomicrobium sp.]|nr:sugar kinase [Sinomicrobium sp.]
MSEVHKTLDIICAGELLIDLIGHQPERSLSATKDYHRYLGGSPANVAVNMARLGCGVALAASVGNDGFGDYIVKRLDDNAVDTRGVFKLSDKNTTVIVVSRTKDSPEFIPYREADYHIGASQLPDDMLENARIFHTTCFALSKDPARETILEKAGTAHKKGCTLSIDFNYSEKIWPDKQEAVAILQAFCRYNPLVKVSKDDISRLFGETMSHEDVFAYLYDSGVETVCLTLGGDGAKLAKKGRCVMSLSAQKIEKIMDATGAGDAFWSGFLFAYLKGRSLDKCMETALHMAALKLQHVGRIPDYA